MGKIFKFEKSKFPIMKIAFLILIFYSILSIFAIYSLNKYEMYIPSYSAPTSEISINVTLKEKIDKGIFACTNDYCMTLQSDSFNNVNTGVFATDEQAYLNKRVNRILIASIIDPDKLQKNIESINLHVGTKDYYYDSDSISKFKTEKLKVDFKDSDLDKAIEYTALILPSTDTSNYKGIYNQICTGFLSLFYNWQMYIIPYFWLFVAFLLYNFKKDEINIDIKLNDKFYKGFFIFTVLAAIALRLNLFTYYPLWIDEIYTKTTAIASLKGCFSDPGNPPLFFILEYLFTKIFGNSDIALRALPFIFGCFVPYFMYLIFKNINKNTALFAMFFAAINTILIYHSTEARSYSLCMLLSVMMVYYLFKWLKDFKNKDLIIYFVLALCSINTYFYLCVLTFTNFLWGIFSLIENKKIDELKKFVGLNILAGLSFLPYLIFTFKNSMNDEFNSWIAKLDISNFNYIIQEYFINKYIFLILCLILLMLLICAFIPNKTLKKINLIKDIKKETLFIYLIYTLTFILIILSIVSICIKPILHKRLLLSLYGLFLMVQIITISTIFDFENIKEKIGNNFYIIKTVYSIILILFSFSITKPMNLKDTYRIDPYMHFMFNDSKQFHQKGYEVHAILAAEENYINHFIKNNEYDYIIWHFTDTTSGKSDLSNIKEDDYIKSDNPAVFYVSSLAADIGIASLFNPNYYPYISNTFPNNYTKIVYNKGKKKGKLK